MAVQRAAIERKHSALHTDFAREFMTRRFGETDTSLIYSLLPTYARGPRKGLVRGYIHWDKVTVGGWKRDADGRGHVERPGTRNVRIREDWFGDKEDGMSIAPTRRYENETDAEREKYIREMLGLMFGRKSQLYGPIPATLTSKTVSGQP